MTFVKRLIDFLNKLQERQIYYRLNKVRDAIMVEVAVPGQRWEVEFFCDGTLEVERFVSTGEIQDASALHDLFS